MISDVESLIGRINNYGGFYPIQVFLILFEGGPRFHQHPLRTEDNSWHIFGISNEQGLFRQVLHREKLCLGGHNDLATF